MREARKWEIMGVGMKAQSLGEMVSGSLNLQCLLAERLCCPLTEGGSQSLRCKRPRKARNSTRLLLWTLLLLIGHHGTPALPAVDSSATIRIRCTEISVLRPHYLLLSRSSVHLHSTRQLLNAGHCASAPLVATAAAPP